MTTHTRIKPGETREEFIARIVATAHRPSAAAMARLRRLLPPVPRPATTADAA